MTALTEERLISDDQATALDEAAALLTQPGPGGRVLTQSDLARMVGVSRWTINRALKGDVTVQASTRERIAEIARQYRYRPSAAARTLRNRASRQVGVLIPNSPGDRFTHPLAFEAILGVNEGLREAGFIACLARIDDVQADLQQSSRVFEEHVLDGMIVLDSMPPEVEQRLEALQPNCIWADSSVWRDERCVRRDEFAAGQMAAQRAIALGYRNLVWLGFAPHGKTHYSHLGRVDGVMAAVSKHDDVALTHTSGYLKADEWLELFAQVQRDPKAVLVCETAYIAKSLLPRMAAAGVRIGHDIGVICCDDSHEIWRHWRGLSRVSFDRFELGKRAAEMMLALINQPDKPQPSVKLPVEWQIGHSAWGPRGM